MKTILRASCLALCVVFLLVSGVSCRRVTEGRYVERDITPEGEEEILAVFWDGDALVAYTKGLMSVYTSTDKGESWTREEGPSLEDLAAREVQRLVRASDGTLVYYAWEDYENSLVKIPPGGEETAQPLEGFIEAVEGGEKAHISHMDMVSQDQLLITYYVNEYYEDGEEEESNLFSGYNYETQWTAGLYDLNTGEIICELNPYNASGSVSSDSGYFYVMTSIGNIFGFEAATGENTYEFLSLEEVDLSDISATHMSLPAEGEGKLYGLNGKRLWEVDLDKFRTELVMDSAYYRFGDPKVVLEDMIHLGNEDFLIQLSTEDEVKLYRYTYDEASEIDQKKQLYIWTLGESETVRSTVRLYMEAYPDASVRLEVAMTESSAMTESDALRDLNTRMLAGDGPDILLLDGSSIDTYIENELLLDLRGNIDFSDVLDPIQEEYDREEGIYYFPARFSLPVLMWNDDSPKEITSFDDFITTMIEENSERTSPAELVTLPKEERASIRFFTVEELFDILWKSSQNEIVREDGLDSDALRYLLENMEKVYGGLHTGSLNYYTIRLGNRGVVFDEGPNRYLAKQAHYGAYVAEDLLSLGVILSTNSHYSAFTGLSDGVWLSSNFVGVSADTSSEEYALEFVQLLFSERAQATLADGIPVTYQGAELQRELISEEGLEADVDLEALLAEMRTPVEMDVTIYTIVTETIERYRKAQISLDEAVIEIEEGINKYFAEKT